jgi:predicted AAA+ superfamily ATPase
MHTMIERHYTSRLRRLLTQFPAVTVLGPRQCGKTTFIRQALPDWTYLDLERPSDVTPLAADPEARLGQLGGHVILDEAQRLPDLFPVLRSVLDATRSRKGRFVLLGSASPSLVRAISESLAGRTAFLDLAPLRWDEVADRRNPRGIKTLWFRGGYPEAYLQRDDNARWDWLESYTRAFIERDLAALGIEVSAVQMRRLWSMLAHCNGAIWNASQLAASLGVSYHTVNRYVEILEQTFLIRKLPPFYANVRKRLVKSPKVYFRDTGLLHYFLGIRGEATLDTHPSRGLSWEGFVIDQLISAFQRHAAGSQAFFWRTAQGDEVDLLIDVGGRQIPFEVKLHSAPAAHDARTLLRCMQDLGLPRGHVIYPGEKDYSLGGGASALSARRLLSRPQDCVRL